jgi:hypothetical protein
VPPESRYKAPQVTEEDEDDDKDDLLPRHRRRAPQAMTRGAAVPPESRYRAPQVTEEDDEDLPPRRRRMASQVTEEDEDDDEDDLLPRRRRRRAPQAAGQYMGEEEPLSPPLTCPSCKPLGQAAIIAAAPPMETTFDQCLEIDDLTPGVVTDIVNGQRVLKRIIGYRNFGRVPYLILRSLGTNPDYKNRYKYKLVPARQYGEALELFQANGGKAVENIGKGRPAKHQLLSTAHIAGVASVIRDKEKKYKIEAITTILICFKGESKFLWWGRSILSNRYGEKFVQKIIDRCLFEAGQKAPKAPTKRVFFDEITTSDEDEEDSSGEYEYPMPKSEPC